MNCEEKIENDDNTKDTTEIEENDAKKTCTAPDEKNTEKDVQTPVKDNIINSDNTCDEKLVLIEQLKEKEIQLKEHIELVQRVKAEFDNYRKRTSKEKEQLYIDIKGDIVTKLLPIIDNLERALESKTSSENKDIVDGVEMILKQFLDILSKEGVKEIETANQQFDPNYHNAVMHVEDESFGTNTIVEVLQKGYKINDRVLRHSMVKVAN